MSRSRQSTLQGPLTATSAPARGRPLVGDGRVSLAVGGVAVLCGVLAALGVGCPAGTRSLRWAPAERPARTGSATTGPLRVLLTAGLKGATEPCGCTVDLQEGGIGKLAAVIRAARTQAAHSVVLDGGDLLTASLPVPPGRAAQEEARAGVLLEMLGLVKYDGLLAAELDVSLRHADLAERARVAQVPLLTPERATSVGQPLVFAAGRVRLGVLPVFDSSLLGSLASGPGEGVSAPEPAPLRAELVQQGVDALRRSGATHVLVLGHCARRVARRMLQGLAGVDFWLVAHGGRDSEQAEAVGTAFLLEVGPEGRRVGCLDLHVDPEDPAGRLVKARSTSASEAQRDLIQRRIRHVQRKVAALPEGALKDRQRRQLAAARAELAALAARPGPGTPGSFSWSLLPVAPSVTPAPDVERLRLNFNARLREINLASSAPPKALAAGSNGYAGSAVCAECHTDQAAQWRTTPHAHALETLAQRGKEYDDECVGCHVVGYREPGGSTLGHIGDLAHVGCEACHGPASLHAADPTAAAAPAAKVGPEPCLKCHVPAHSPRFDFSTYLPRVLGHGHGE